MDQVSTSVYCDFPVTARAKIVTVRDVIDHIQEAESLQPVRRTQILSALRTLARVLGLDAGDIFAEPAALRARLEGISHARVGLTQSRWAAIRSLTVAALKECGFDIMPSRRMAGILTPSWAIFCSQLQTKQLQFGLSRFVSFCSTTGVEPEMVETNTFANFELALETGSLVRNTKRAYRTTLSCWNKARAMMDVPVGAEAHVPSADLQYAFSWDEFPPSFTADAEAYLNRAANPDPFSDDYSKPLRPETIKVRRQQIVRIASVLVTPTFPASRVTGLATLIDTKNARVALRFFLDRADGNTTAAIYHYATLLRTIAKHWVKPKPVEAIKELDTLCKNLLPKSQGMTPKNRGRLRQFDDPRNIDALLDLPDRLMRRARTVDDQWAPTHVAYAIAIELLITTTMRIKNLTELEVERHFVRPQIGGRSMVHIVVPGDETKTGAPIERELPHDTVKRLETYLRVFRPRLASGPSKMLFPNTRGEKRHPSAFGGGIAKIILKETGLAMHPHLFRHAAAKFHMEKHPEDVETVRRILGHKSLETTMRFYAEMKTAAAFGRYDQVIADMRDEGKSRLHKPKKTAGRGGAR